MREAILRAIGRAGDTLELYDSDSEEDNERMAELLADLMHLCDEEDYNFSAVVVWAERLYKGTLS